MPATDRDLLRLTGVHPTLVEKVKSLLDKFPMFVVQGVRTAEYQHSLYLQGRDGGPAGSKIVTFKDGYVHKSNHQPHADGLGHAVDLAWLGGDPFSVKLPWDAYGQAVEAAGLKWGGRWKMVDRPHVEMPDSDPKS